MSNTPPPPTRSPSALVGPFELKERRELGLRARLPSSATPDPEPPSNYWADESRYLARTPLSASTPSAISAFRRFGLNRSASAS